MLTYQQVILMSEAEPVVHRYYTLGQTDDLRDAAHSREARYDTSFRDETYIVLSADLGTRVGETVPLTQQMFNLEAEEVTIPAGTQKDCPIDGI